MTLKQIKQLSWEVANFCEGAMLIYAILHKNPVSFNYSLSAIIKTNEENGDEDCNERLLSLLKSCRMLKKFSQ